jgi:EAL domain-containing protein (putative c-di-GMP-specific phosphodiesterase class I)/GGDEF domain-containing protein
MTDNRHEMHEMPPTAENDVVRPAATPEPAPSNARVLSLDGGGRIIGASHGAADWLGLNAPRLVGRSLWDVALPTRRRDRNAVTRRGAAVLDDFVGTTFEAEVRLGGGSTRRETLRLTAPDGGAAAYIATFGRGTSAANAAAIAVPARAAPSATAAAAPAPRVAAAPASPFRELLARGLAAVPTTGSVALLRVRIIDLPLVTAALGRATGDRLLGHIKAEIAEALPRAAAVSHIGIVLVGLPGNGTAEARAAADTISARLAEKVVIDGQELRQACAIGIALAPRHGDDPDVLLALADQAARPLDGVDMAGVRVATVVHDDSAALLRLRTRLEGVAERGELRLLYQPIFDLAREVPYGVEALLRWEDPDLGLISPADFIPVAEDTGAIEELGGWVVAELCRHAFAWRTQGIALQLHFNVSPVELRRRSFASRLLSIIRAYTLPPSTFTLEVTESTVMLDADTVVPTLQRLRAEGMQIAIDDFGAGHSSLSRLKELPADILKIDRALVSGLPHDKASRALVSAALHIADALGMQAVAEGIESDAEHRALVELGCPLGQGYGLGRPAEADSAQARGWTDASGGASAASRAAVRPPDLNVSVDPSADGVLRRGSAAPYDPRNP